MVEVLKKLYGDAVTEESLERFKEELGKKFVPKSDFNQRGEDVKTLREQLAVKEAELLETEQLYQEKEALAGELCTLRAQYEEEIAGIRRKEEQERFDRALEGVLSSAKARNVTAVKSLLDMQKITWTDGNLQGLEEQLTALKAEHGYLFEPGEGNVQFVRPTMSAKSEITREDFQNMGYMERLKLKKGNPALYQSFIQK